MDRILMSPNQNPLPIIKSAAAVILVLAAHFCVAVPTEDTSPTSTVDKRALSPLVSGSPPGFASNTTGGGTASPVYPTSIAQLTTYLTSSSPQVIVLSGTYDFAGSEGTVTKTACNAYSCTPAQGGQALLNALNGCASNLALYDVNIDQAAFSPIWVRSDKTVVGTNGATIKGKGFRLSGVANIIFQNIHVTELNPAYVWGGDAFALTDTSNVWIDHVTTSRLGRQHYSFGQGPSAGITISNSFIDGYTPYSATCDQRTYWGFELVGSGDSITFIENHVYLLSGRGPALSGNTLWHAVNNVWSSSGGHLIEGTDNAMGVYEGNYFQDCPTIVGIPLPSVRLFTSVAAEVGQCASRLGRNCVPNLAVNSSAFSFSNLDALASFAGKSNIPAAHTGAWTRDNVVANAGNVL
ncbi:hypothetical protein QTJ16_001859 [Diplocarpon rosae]|uniref:pectin lyase n=1 Tax=Diplocarpon rosae TaxID=946125 RepID=A0AAD9WGT6_9HELO|nr:hypothetical protein QTJ16_001859 [Diplocarpon rosae]